VMYQPPSPARSDYSPYIVRNGSHLLAYPDGDVLSGPGSADDGPCVGDRKDAGLEPRPAGHRALHRAQGAQRAQPAERAEQPGITWGRAGPARRIHDGAGMFSRASRCVVYSAGTRP
jgi:hypothetical protein